MALHYTSAMEVHSWEDTMLARNIAEIDDLKKRLFEAEDELRTMIWFPAMMQELRRAAATRQRLLRAKIARALARTITNRDVTIDVDAGGRFQISRDVRSWGFI